MRLRNSKETDSSSSSGSATPSTSASTSLSSVDSFSRLPNELKLMIQSNLDNKSLGNLARTSKAHFPSAQYSLDVRRQKIKDELEDKIEKEFFHITKRWEREESGSFLIIEAVRKDLLELVPIIMSKFFSIRSNRPKKIRKGDILGSFIETIIIEGPKKNDMKQLHWILDNVVDPHYIAHQIQEAYGYIDTRLITNKTVIALEYLQELSRSYNVSHKSNRYFIHLYKKILMKLAKPHTPEQGKIYARVRDLLQPHIPPVTNSKIKEILKTINRCQVMLHFF